MILVSARRLLRRRSGAGSHSAHRSIGCPGALFTDASTTSSVCSPTRYSLLTGRYCWRTSLKFETLNTFAPLHIEPGRLNLASLLKGQGYRTAAIGKWHLGYGAGREKPITPGR